MRKIFTIFLSIFLVSITANNLFAQDTLVAWTFPSTSSDSLADKSIAINSTAYISCQYGTFGAPSYVKKPIDYTTNGSLGSPDKCGKAIGWDNGIDSTSWMIFFKTTGYTNLKVYSKIQGGGNNPGPRDYTVQWKQAGSSTWTDLTGGTIVCGNNWTAGAISGVSLPLACENQSDSIYLRWVVKSNFDINGATLLSTGISKIDDIMVTGTNITGLENNKMLSSFLVYPNPSLGSFFIENNCDAEKIEIYNMLGTRVYEKIKGIEKRTEIAGFESGVYFVQIKTKTNRVLTKKLIIQ